MVAVQNNAIDELTASLLGQHRLLDDKLGLTFGEFNLQLRSNSSKLLHKLAHYFSPFVGQTSQAEIEVIAIEDNAPQLAVDFIDWPREPGKAGRKDSYIDFMAYRLLRKVRTGMAFLQGKDLHIAAGPCIANENQVINFINAQYMTWLQHRDWLICHASALVTHGRAYAFAGFSGGGKSTLMLHLMNNTASAYLTNDRLFLRTELGYTNAAGIPKLPRVNPGTIVHNPRLHGLIPEKDRQALLAMPHTALWQLEDKYDVNIEQVYGTGRIAQEAPLAALIILNWQHDSKRELTVAQVQLGERPELLAAIMKSPGPFYQYPDGRFYQSGTALAAQSYLQLLQDVTIYEVSGGVDFDRLCHYCATNIIGQADAA